MPPRSHLFAIRVGVGRTTHEKLKGQILMDSHSYFRETHDVKPDKALNLVAGKLNKTFRLCLGPCFLSRMIWVGKGRYFQMIYLGKSSAVLGRARTMLKETKQRKAGIVSLQSTNDQQEKTE